MNLTPQSLEVLQRVADRLRSGFSQLPDAGPDSLAHHDQGILDQVAIRMQDNYPYFHPFYLGQMLKPPHPIAHMAYALAMSINPNNHAHDGGRASSTMEVEAVQDIATMFGWQDALGHLCGGGTIANIEALWVSRELTGGRGIAVSQQAHYTHSRCARLLAMDCHIIPTNTAGQMDIDALAQTLSAQNIGTVVVTLGTTGLGTVDRLDEILTLQERHGFRIHIDSAYGGYFRLADNLPVETARQFELMDRADSIVVDPHKHGLQPYGCGCVLFKDHEAASVYFHDSPYTYFSSEDRHLGEISLECSRPGASAVALWATLQRFPLTKGGEFARGLEQSRNATCALFDFLSQSASYTPIMEPELDIVVWSVDAESASESSRLAKLVFEAAAANDLHLALITLPRKLVDPCGAIANWDQEQVTCLRACLMKADHFSWMPKILDRLKTVTEQTLPQT